MRWKADLRRWFTRFYARQVSERTPGGGCRASISLAVDLPIATGQRAKYRHRNGNQRHGDQRDMPVAVGIMNFPITGGPQAASR